MLVLIVKEDLEMITKCTHRIKACVQSVRPHVSIQYRSLRQHSNEQFSKKCDKVIFLLSSNPDSTETAQKEWIGKLPKIQNESNYKIIQLNKFCDSNTGTEEHLEMDNENIIQISNFEKDIFQWWPKVLVFLFGKQSVGSWFDKNNVPSQHRFCLHCLPNREETAHPVTRDMLEMLQIFGARKVYHCEDRQCCILICKEASMRLPQSIQSVLANTAKSVHVLGVALKGTDLSDDIVKHTDRRFTTQKLMSLVLVLLAELSLINTKTVHQPMARRGFNLHVPSLLLYFAAHLVFIFNFPALVTQMAAAMVFPWPLIVCLLVQDHDKKVKFINLGFAGSSIALIIILIVTESVLFPEFFPFPISVPVSMYLLIWQIGFGLKLNDQNNFEYGIYSIPSKILNRA